MTSDLLLSSVREDHRATKFGGGGGGGGLGASAGDCSKASLSAFSYSFNNESAALQSKLDELALKISTTAGVLKYEQAAFKKQSETFGNALLEARHGKDHLERDIEDALAMIVELQERRRLELEHYEVQLEELTLKSRSISSSLQEEIEHWQKEAYISREALEEANIRSWLMKKEMDNLQASKWAIEELRTKERKELENAMEVLRASHNAREHELLEELKAAAMELDLSKRALEMATSHLETIQEESQERIDELEAELEEVRRVGREAGGGGSLRSKLAQQLRQSNDRVDVYGKELEEAKRSERKWRRELKAAKKQISFLEVYVEDSRAAIQDLKRCDRIEKEELTITLTKLEDESNRAKAQLEKELTQAKLELLRAQKSIDSSEDHTGLSGTTAVARLVNSDDESTESEMMESAAWKLNMAESGDGSIDTDVVESDAWKTDSDSDGISVEGENVSQGTRRIPTSFGQRRGNFVEITKK
jgi:hypothetical protein